jgi:hypothetical protein
MKWPLVQRHQPMLPHLKAHTGRIANSRIRALRVEFCPSIEKNVYCYIKNGVFSEGHSLINMKRKQEIVWRLGQLPIGTRRITVWFAFPQGRLKSRQTHEEGNG